MERVEGLDGLFGFGMEVWLESDAPEGQALFVPRDPYPDERSWRQERLDAWVIRDEGEGDPT